MTKVTPEQDARELGYRMQAMHEPGSVKAGPEAREMLASLMEPQFPVEAEMARKGLHFMLPASWAAEAIHAALSRPATPIADTAIDEGVIERVTLASRASYPTHPKECALVEKADLRALLALTRPTPTAPDHKLLELLAVIHRDGGQYVGTHGIEKAWADAMQLSSERIATAPTAGKVELHKWLSDAMHGARINDNGQICLNWLDIEPLEQILRALQSKGQS